MKTARRSAYLKKKAPLKKYQKKSEFDRWQLEPATGVNYKRDDTLASVNFATSAATAGTNVFLIPQGVEINQRNGRRVRIMSIRFTFDLIYGTPVATSVELSNTLRVMLVYDREPKGVAPLFSSVVADYGGTSEVYEAPNFDNRSRFKILRDQRIATPAILSTIAGGLLVGGNIITPPTMSSTDLSYSFYKKVGGKLQVIYSGAAGTTANQAEGGLFLFCQCNSTSNWFCQANVSTEFVDF